MSAMRGIHSSLAAGCLVLLLALAGTGCAEVVEPVLDVRSGADESRPEIGSDCVSADELSVTADQIIYIVHALPEGLGGSPGELEVTISTGCEELTQTATHDEDGIALVPLSLPEGAECGAVVTTSIANAIDRCVLAGASEQSSGCSVVCTETDDDETTDTDTDTDSTG